MKRLLIAILVLLAAPGVMGASVTWEYPPLRCPETFDSCRITFNHNYDSAGTVLLTDTNAIYFSRATSDTLSNTFDARIYYPGFTQPVSFSDDMGNHWGASGDTVDYRPMFFWAEDPDTAVITTIINWTDTTYDTVLSDSYWIDTVSVPDTFTVQVTADLNYTGEWVAGGILHLNANPKRDRLALPNASGYATISGYIYYEGHATDTANVGVDGIWVHASRITNNEAIDTSGASSAFIYSVGVGDHTDTTGKFEFYLKRTGEYADTTEGFYNVKAEDASGTVIFDVRRLYVSDTGNIDLGLIEARR